MMPRTSVWILRFALGCLVAGAAVGTLAATGLGPQAQVVAARLHVDLVLFGFMLPFAVGTAWWILPKKGGVRPIDIPAALFVIGLFAVLTATLLGGAAGLAAGGYVLMLGSVGWTVRALWPRVQPIIAWGKR
jgi:hypothetical protein